VIKKENDMMDITRFVVGVVCVIRRKDTILALRRRPTQNSNPGVWECIAGKVDIDEHPTVAALREIHEESGLAVNLNKRPIAALTTRRNQAPMVLVIYEAKYDRGEVILSEEHDKYAWMTTAEFAAVTPFQDLAVLIAKRCKEKSHAQ
jgi:8-oxo-dGTP diphosphatase